MRRIALVLLFVAFGWTGSAQTGTGGIRGAVTSPDGPVAAAPVRAKQQSTGMVFSTTSANSGQFAFTNLPAGIYEVSVPSIGLSTAPFVQQNVNVEAGTTTSLNIALVKGNLGVIGDDNAYLAIRNKYSNVRGAAPRLADGRPDLSGIWNANGDPNPEPVSLLPWAEDVMKMRRETQFRDAPASRCLPDDPTPSIPLLHKFVQTRMLMVVLFEQEPHYRQIFLDGRPHPTGLDPTWMGHSIGRWDKDTLVVDTIGFNDKSWIIFPTGLPHTEMLHMIERYRRPDLGHLTVDLTLEDAGTFRKPIERHMTWQLAPGEEILESVCTENNKYAEYAGLK